MPPTDKPIQYGPHGGAYVESPTGGKRYVPDLRQHHPGAASGEQLGLPLGPTALRRWQTMRRSPQLRAEQNRNVREAIASVRAALFQRFAREYQADQTTLPGMEGPRESPSPRDAARNRLREAMDARREAIGGRERPEVRQGTLGLDESGAGSRGARNAVHPRQESLTSMGHRATSASTPEDFHKLANELSHDDPRRPKLRDLARRAEDIQENITRATKEYVGDDFHKAMDILDTWENDPDSLVERLDPLGALDVPAKMKGLWGAAGDTARKVYNKHVDDAVREAWSQWDRSTDYEAMTREWFLHNWDGENEPSVEDVFGGSEEFTNTLYEHAPGSGPDGDFISRLEDRAARAVNNYIRVVRSDYEKKEEEPSYHGSDGPDTDNDRIFTHDQLLRTFPDFEFRKFRQFTDRDGYEADLYKDGEKVGEVQRTRSGSTVSHDYFEITDRSLRGGGAATKMMQSSLKDYLAHGVKEVVVHAALDNGAYTWARCGFDFEDESERAKARYAVSGVLRNAGWTSERAEARAKEVCAHAWTLAAWHEPGVDVSKDSPIATAKSSDEIKDLMKQHKASPGDREFWHTGKRVLLDVMRHAHYKIDLVPGSPSYEFVKRKYGVVGPWENVNAPTAGESTG